MVIKVQSKVIPENWKPNHHESIKKWMEGLPEVKDINNAIKNDNKW